MRSRHQEISCKHFGALDLDGIIHSLPLRCVPTYPLVLPTSSASTGALDLALSSAPPGSLGLASTPSLELASSFLSPALTPASLAYYRKTMRHKRNLILVCRKWHGYAQPVLYAFACGLPPSSTPSAASRSDVRGVGRFIRWLHIETPAPRGAEGRAAAAELDELGRPGAGGAGSWAGDGARRRGGVGVGYMDGRESAPRADGLRARGGA
ncbi:hypothetical protein FB451DRAFT_1395876 [Mycena latifolia]|nr:hypothetical protein FB451DRAFT_1395876 [Mycena latifolia]